MTRNHWLVTLTVALTVFAAGCGGAAEKPAAPASHTAPAAAPSNQQGVSAATDLAFEVITESMLPPELATWKSMTQLPKSTPSARVGDHLYVVVVGSMESAGAPAIAVKQVELVEQPGPAVTVKAVVTAGASGAEIMTFPRSYIRVPYAASLPVPVVTTHIQVEASGGASPRGDTAAVTNPSTPVSSPPVTPPGVVTNPPASSIVDASATVTMLAESALPAALSSWKESTVQAPGGVGQYLDGALYLMVSGGQRNSGGYSVQIKSVQVQNGTVHVTALLNSPKPGAMVTMALTYPRAYAKVGLSGTGQPPVLVEWQ